MGETESTRAVVYTRVNHAAQGNSGAAEVAAKRQYEACWKLAEERGFTVVAEYGDVTGAACIEQRPALQRMLDELTARQVGYVVVSDVARISRNVRELTAFEERLMCIDAALLICGEGPEQATARRRMTEILAGFDQEETPSASPIGKSAQTEGDRA